jgi:2-polyprenyl-3-methyl-5-hydroxy-6-metoxy-1,4-benzoquinol methylase
MPYMDRAAWDERYAATDLVWSAEPNRFVEQIVGSWSPGRALDIACGEGRNAIWLARQGWEVTAVDFSQVALRKAEALAEDNDAHVTWVHGDVLTYEPPSGSFDLVLLAYLQLDSEQMTAVLERAAQALVPGGAVVFVAHARINLDGGYGGPRDPAVLYDPAEVAGWLHPLAVERAEHVTRTVSTVDGERVAIDLVVLARRPNS